MFNEPGSKIKVVAQVFFWLSTFVCILFAFLVGFRGSKFDAIGFFCLLILGPIGSYISSLLIYGFGQLVANSEKDHPEEDDE